MDVRREPPWLPFLRLYGFSLRRCLKRVAASGLLSVAAEKEAHADRTLRVAQDHFRSRSRNFSICDEQPSSGFLAGYSDQKLAMPIRSLRCLLQGNRMLGGVS